MNKKHCFIKVVAGLGICAAIAGCSKFLDMAPDENLTLDDVFANRVYTRDFLTHIYSWIPTEANMADDGGAWRNPFTAGCDEMEIAFGGAYAHQINNGGWNPTDVGRVQVWSESYMALRKVNMFISRVDECPTSETDIRHWKGEAHFLRAYFHFLAFRAYGPIPLVDHAFDPSEDMMAVRRSPADRCAEFIVKDCIEAAKLLNDVDRWSATETGRATRLSALALKSRVLLYIASPLYNGNTDLADWVDPVDNTPLINQVYSDEKWKAAADAAEECINACKAAGRSLYRKYEDPVENYQNIFIDNWNDEILWARNIGTYDHWLNCGDPVSFGCFSILNPTQELVDAYEMENGLAPIEGYTNDGLTPVINPESGYVEQGFAEEARPGRWQAGVSNMYVGREPRFYASINFAGAQWKTNAPNYTPGDAHTLEFWYEGVDGKGRAGSDYCKTGYLMKKLLYPTRIPWKYTPLMQWVYIRLGEIYLNYAEAINEYSGPEAAYEAINEIRDRAGLPALPSGLSKEEMRDRIKHERRIELAFEVHRFFDVRRWKDAEKTENMPVHSMNIFAGKNMQDPDFYKRIEVEKRVFQAPKHYFFPVSQTEVDKNDRRLLVQSPGWITTPVE